MTLTKTHSLSYKLCDISALIQFWVFLLVKNNLKNTSVSMEILQI